MKLLEGIVSLLSEIDNVELTKIDSFYKAQYNNLMFGYLATAAKEGALSKEKAEKIFNSIQSRLVDLRKSKPSISSKIDLPIIKNVKNMKPEQIVLMSQKYFNKLFELDKYKAAKAGDQVIPILKDLPDEVTSDMVMPPDMPQKSWEQWLAQKAGTTLPKLNKPQGEKQKKELPPNLPKQPSVSKQGSPLPPKKGQKVDLKGKPVFPPEMPSTVTPDMIQPPDLPKNKGMTQKEKDALTKLAKQKNPPPMPADRNAPGQEMKHALAKMAAGKPSGIKKKRTYKVTDKDIMGPAESVVRESLDRALSEMLFRFFEQEIF